MVKNLFKREEGQRGEEIAVAYLKEHGFKIIDRNFRIQGGEIDIVSIDHGVLVFTEVKTRKSSSHGTPLEAISYWKLKSLIKTAYFYKTKYPSLPDEMRIDAIAIMLDEQNRPISIELVKSITS